MVHDRLSCIMAAINHLKDREGREYGARYGQFVADTTPYERELLVDKGRRMLERRDAIRLAARGRKQKVKGEGKYI